MLRAIEVEDHFVCIWCQHRFWVPVQGKTTALRMMQAEKSSSLRFQCFPRWWEIAEFSLWKEQIWNCRETKIARAKRTTYCRSKRVLVSFLPCSPFTVFFEKRKIITKTFFKSYNFFSDSAQKKSLYNTILKYHIKTKYRKEVSIAHTQIDAARLLWATTGSSFLVLIFPFKC